MATNESGDLIIKWPKQYAPLPPGYVVVLLDSGYYMWILEGPIENVKGMVSWDKWWVRQCAFNHYKENRCPSN